MDGSPFSEHSLPLATAISRSSGALVHLAHVHRDHPPDDLISNTQFQFEGLDFDEYEARHRAEEHDYLAVVAARMKESSDMAPEQVLLEGDVVSALEGHAKENVRTLIVMTTHGRGGLSRLWLGSIADVLVRRTHLPVRLVRPDPSESGEPVLPALNHLLVPLDGSEHSERILETVRQLATALGSRVTLLHVVQSVGRGAVDAPPLSPGVLEELERRAERYLSDIATRLAKDAVNAKTRVVMGASPATTILDAARELEVDLIAMSTHGQRGFTRAVLGSVADKVLRGSALPVLLERPLTEHLE